MNRRRFLKSAGATGVVATAVFGAGCASNDGNVVSLAERGLSDGDLIDPLLREHFNDGVELHVPGGTYRWEGTGLDATADAALVGDGHVVFDTGEIGVWENITATEGTVTIQNVTQRGPVTGRTDSRIAAWAEGDAKLVIENFNRPDGQADGGETTGFYVPDQHSGTVVFRNCAIQRCNNGIYADAPGERGSGSQGKVVVEGGLYRNNNVAAVRLGSDDSVARHVTVVNDEPIPVDAGGDHNGRGIWIREPGNDISIEHCDITFAPGSGGATHPVIVHPQDPGSSGAIRNCRIRNGRESDPILIADTERDSWSGEGIHLTGRGDLTPSPGLEGWFECTGPGCDLPTVRKQRVPDLDLSPGPPW